jgi:transposase InsO family protein
MKDNAKEFSIVEMARIFDVTPSGYYSYCSRGLSQRAVADTNLLDEIKNIFYENQQTYGRYRMYRELKKTGEICSQRRVSRLMKEANLVAKARRRFKVTTKANSDATAAPNKLKQNFKANKPNEKWVSDLTYVWTSAGWLYLAVVMDLFSRKIVGMAMGNRISKELVCKAFLQAMLRRGYPVGFLYHSDRGSQYTSNDFQQLMQLYKIQVSMSGKGNCYDNAAMESFFHTLKLECTDDLNFKTRGEAMNNIFDYIEIFYNNQRMHSYLGYLSPNDFEMQFGSRK